MFLFLLKDLLIDIDALGVMKKMRWRNMGLRPKWLEHLPLSVMLVILVVMGKAGIATGVIAGIDAAIDFWDD